MDRNGRLGLSLLASLGFAILAGLAAAPGRAAGRAADTMARAGAGTVEGGWLDQSGKAGIEIAPCGDRLCGTIRWLRKPLTEDGKAKTDIHNPDPALHARPVCGLVMLGGFVPGDDPGHWRGGWIYDPEHGDTYKSNMHVNADGTLSVRGYIGILLIGKSRTWTPFKGRLLPGDCAAPAP